MREIDIELMGADASLSRQEKLEALSAEIERTASDDEPPESEAHLWHPVVDMDTNKVRWVRKDLWEAIQELRFSPSWHSKK